MEAKSGKPSSTWVRIGVDYGALVAFLGVLVVTKNFELATLVLIVVSVVAVATGYIVERRVAPLPLMSAAFSIVFGGLTLVFHDKSYVKMKLTFVEGTLAAVMLGGLALGKNPLKAVMGDSLRMADAAWRVLTVRYSVFFIVAAIANEFVWRTQSDLAWAWFKGGVAVAAVLFSLTQTPFILKHAEQGEPVAPPEPPDPGF